MTRDEFKTIVAQVESFYPGKIFMKDKVAFDRWYDELKVEDYEDVLEAAKEHCRNIEFLPCLANIKYRLEIIRDRRRGTEMMIKQLYNVAISRYPGGGNDESYRAFVEASEGCKDPIAAAQWLSQKICDNEESGIPLVEVIEKVAANEL